MADFVLVHGGLHGGSCWDLLRPELERAGHRTFAMDLPIDQPGKLMDDYADAAVAALAGTASDDAYLVGHSMGGMVIPRMLAGRPKARLIFLCAGFAHTTEEERLESFAATTSDFFDWLIADDQGRVTMSKEDAIEAFYHDVAPDLADRAYSNMRLQWAEGFSRVGPIAPYAEHVAHVICTTDDRIIDPVRHRRMSEARFGIIPIEMPGSHSPFLSHPAELAGVLDKIVKADRAGGRV
ncbi:MAG: alpha/beta hydrolase [Rhodospirillales bacterium]|nr:alpha/beta hydrolase [Rhodospirillales bacterium]